MDSFIYSQPAFLRTRRTRKPSNRKSFYCILWSVFSIFSVYLLSGHFIFSSISSKSSLKVSNSSTLLNHNHQNLQREKKGLESFYLSWFYEGRIENLSNDTSSSLRRKTHFSIEPKKKKHRKSRRRSIGELAEALRLDDILNVSQSNVWKLKTGNFPDSGPLITAPPFEGLQNSRVDPDWEESQDLAELTFNVNRTTNLSSSKITTPWTYLEEIPSQSNIVVCWNGAPLSWENSGIDNSNLKRRSMEETIQVTGEGCHRCIVGLFCEFMLKFNFINPSQLEFFRRQEIIVTLTGPSVLQAEVIELAHTRNSVVFSASYQLWDKGQYSVSVKNDCYPFGRETASRELAEFEITVYRLSPSLRNNNPIRPTSPCDIGHISRWYISDFNKGGDTAFHTPFPCTGEFFPVDGIIEELVSKDIKELSFVGGSNQLGTFLHIQDLLTDGDFFTKDVTKERDIFWSYTQPGTNFTLKMNFYWLENIFKDKEFGCGETPYYATKEEGGREGRFHISEKSKMIFLEVTSWSFENCKNPETAYLRSLPWFLDSFEWWLGSSKAVTHVVWRTAPPFPVPYRGCGGGGARNRAIKKANNYARTLVDRHGYSFFDFWPIESSFYYLSCLSLSEDLPWETNGVTSHYSCVNKDKSRMEGDIGEAVARLLLHRISSYSTPIDW